MAGFSKSCNDRVLRVRVGGIDADLLAIQTEALELHVAIADREECVILGAQDVRTRMELRATLTNDDIARADEFAAEALDTEPLCIGIAPVARRSHSFFMSHD